jgi:RNA polymerase sigma-70 factor (ECF subfamily)
MIALTVPSEVEENRVFEDQSDLKEMLKGIANGDRQAFREFHSRFSGMVYATAVQVLHNHEDAEDCVQDVFTSLWKKAGMYLDDRGKPSTWLAAMARNRAIDKLRARQRRGKLNDSFEAESRVDEPITRIDPAKQAGVTELGETVRSAVLQLTHEQSEAIRMAFFDGLTQLEIAQKTGEPLGTIKARIRRGLGRLRTIVKA